jgi:hypothetical protein
MEDSHLRFPDILIFSEDKRGGHAARVGDMAMHTKVGREG